MKEKPDTWQPLGDDAAKIVAELEQKHRDRFKRDCAEEGVKAKEVAA